MSDSKMYGYPRALVDSDYHRIGTHLIKPFYDGQVQPASYDVTLAKTLLKPRTEVEVFSSYTKGFGTVNHMERPHIDLRRVRPADMMYEHEMSTEGYILEPGEALLGATAEEVSCPDDMICSVDGKSTLGRCFIGIHVTAGFVDPGFRGVITLEIVNHGPWNFLLHPGMRIGQLRFYWLGTQVAKPYGSPELGSHYQDSNHVRGAEGPR